MKNRLSAFFILLVSLLCISCDSILADKLNEKFNLTPPIYLSYNTEYGKTPRRVKVVKGDVITEEMLPSVEYVNNNSSNYYEEEKAFSGWYYDEQYTREVHVGDVIEGAVTLYAKWEYANTYIYFYIKNGYIDKSDKYGYDFTYDNYYEYRIYSYRYFPGTVLSSSNLPVPYYYDDYIFLGWYFDPDFNTPAEGHVLESDITLYAKERYDGYCKIGYSTSWYSESQETKSLKAGEKLDSYYLPQITPYSEYENYEFMGWYYDSEYTRQAQEGDEVNTDIYLYAKWVEKYVYIDYFSYYSFAELPQRKKVENGSPLVLDYMPELTPSSGYEDYRFVGWYYDYEYINEAHVGDVIDRSITLYVKFEPIHVRLYYDTRGYADSIENKVVDNGSILTADLLPELVPYSYYDNLIFAGWYYDSYYESPASVGDILSGDNIWFYAKYDALPNGQFLEYWVFDEGVSLDYELWNGLTCVYNPTNSLTPAELQNDYFYAGEETTAYDSYSYDGVEYTNGNIVKRYYVNPLVSTNNLARLLSLIYVYDFTYDLIITDSNPDVEQIASILKNDNSKRCNINLNLCDNCNQLTSIPDNCFEGVTYLRMIFLPDSLQTIGKNAFKSCSRLSEMHIYPSVTLIDEGAFEDCSIAYVYYRGSVSDRENMIINDTTILNVAWFYNNY